MVAGLHSDRHLSHEAFATAETAITAATYADVTGVSISLESGRWLVMATVLARCTTANQAFMLNAAITDASNNVVAEGTAQAPANGASVNGWALVQLSAIVSPGVTTTYKVRAARGNAAPTNNLTVCDGAATGGANNANNGNNLGTGIRAIRLA